MSERSFLSTASGTSASGSSIDDTLRLNQQPNRSNMSHWRDAPARPVHHTVTVSEPIVGPGVQPYVARQSTSQAQSYHHTASSSYGGSSGGAARNQITSTQAEEEISITLEPINQAMELIRSAVHSRKIPHLQPSTACAISAIRSLLLATDCLSRESGLLSQFPILAKIRKTILANLAELVALARSASQINAESEDGSDLEEFKEAELEGMLKSSEETSNNVRTFLRALIKCDIALPERKDADTSMERATGNRPSLTRGMSSSGVAGVLPNTSTSFKRERERTPLLHAKSMGDLRMARRPSQKQQEAGSEAQEYSTTSNCLRVGIESPSFNAPGQTAEQSPSRARSRTGPDLGSISSFSSVGSSTDYNPLGRDSVSTEPPLEDVNISQGVQLTFDSLVSVTAALIGHVQCHTVASHPSSHALLVELSKETIDRIRDLLHIVELIVSHEATAKTHPREVASLGQAKRHMYATTSALVEAAERVASTPFKEAPSEEDDMNRERLLSAASISIRPARECTRLVKLCADWAPSPTGSGTDFQSVTDRGYPSLVDSTESLSLSKRSSQASLRSTYKSGKSSESAAVTGLTSSSEFSKDLLTPLSAPLGRHGFNRDIEDAQEIMFTPNERMRAKRVDRSPSIPGTPLPHDELPGLSNGTNPLDTPGPWRRSRAASFSSGGNSPQMISTERSPRPPSRSVDLSVAGYDMAFLNTPRPNEEKSDSQQPQQTTQDGKPFGEPQPALSSSLTPKPPRWWTSQNSQGASNLTPMPTDAGRLAAATRQSRFEDAPPTPKRDLTVPAEVSPADMRMFLVSHDYNPKEIAYNSEGALVGATLPVLLEKMTPHDGPIDTSLWDTFFLTFRLFTSPADLLQAIEVRFDPTPPVRMPLQPETVRIWNEMKVAPIRRQIMALVKSWITTYWKQDADNDVIDAMTVFITERLGRSFPSEQAKLLEILEKHKSRTDTGVETSPVARLRQMRSGSTASVSGTPFHRPTFSISSATSSLPPTPIMNKQLFGWLKTGSNQVQVTDFHALELARQLTLLESKLFCAIEPRDLIRLGKNKAESLKTMSTLSTQITGWVAERILDEHDPKKRTGLLKYFIKVSKVSTNCYESALRVWLIVCLNDSVALSCKTFPPSSPYWPLSIVAPF